MNTETIERPMLKIPRSANPVPTPARNRSRSLPVLIYVGGSIALIISLIAGSMQLGWFNSSGRIDAKTGKAIELTSSSVGADIKGWMTLDQVVQGFGLDRAELYAVFGIPSTVDASSSLGELSEAGLGIEIPALRAWIDARASGVTLDEPPAVVGATEEPGSGEASAAEPAGEGAVGAAGIEVRGRTTIAEILDATHVSKETFYARYSIPSDVSTDTKLGEVSSMDGVTLEIPDVRDWANNL